MLFALIVFTIPHGACDVYLPAWILNPPWERSGIYWLFALGIFGFFALFTWSLTLLSYDFFVALLAALIIWHYGSLDALLLYPNRSIAWLIGSMGRGMLVLIAPLHFKPLETNQLFSEFIPEPGSRILDALYSFSGYIILIALLLEGAAFLASKFIEGRGLPRDMSAHVTESLFILATFKLVSPLVGMSFYFLMLHPFRHIARVVDYIPEERGQILDMGGLLKSLPSLFQRTNLITFLASF
ncbi:MAG: hypothetical protein KJT03_07705, partial [Verrucomicrobiae bacterium]|nr:hypothetical protein [Verrucomicrobiae bacterium]